MFKFKKVAAVLALSSALILSSLNGIGYAQGNVYENINRQQLAPGVIHENIVRFNRDGWLNANVMYIDLKEENIEFKLMQSVNGLSTRETLSSMVKREENVVGAMNADFFFMTTPASPTGAIVRDGKMVSSPVIGENLATFAIDYNNMASADYWDYDIYVTTDKGKRINLGAINKYRWEYREIMLIDSNWGTHSPGATERHYDMVEIVVVDNVVTEVRSRKPSVAIPENGYVLLASAAKAYELYNNLQVGDQVTVHTDIRPNIDNIKLAFGGGTVLVKEGKVATFTQNVTGAHPRTAIGISRDRSTLMLVTVDGRHSSYRGVDGRQLAQLLIDLGSYEAIIMDGGGSTTMMARPLGEFETKIINTPSDGIERRIINGVAVISKAPLESLRGIHGQADYPNTLVGVSREITLRAFDKNYNPLAVDYSQVKFTVQSGEGNFEGNWFTPTKSGEAVIIAEYFGSRSEIKINVLGEPALLKVEPEQVRLNFGQSMDLKVVGLDANGYRVPIHSRNLQWRDEKQLGRFQGGRYVAGNQGGATTITGQLGTHTVAIQMAVGYNKVMLEDFETLNAKYFGYPQLVEPVLAELNPNAKEGAYSLALEYDFTKTEETRAAYIGYEEKPITINQAPEKIGLWVHAFEPASHWIRGRIRDASGQTHVIDFKKGIDWTGWRYVDTTLPANLIYPIQLDRIYVVETDASQKTTGKLLFDSLEALYGIGFSATPPQQREVQDRLNKPYEEKGTKIFVHSGLQFQQYTLLDRIVGNKISNVINENHGASIFTGTVDSRVLNNIAKPRVVAATGYELVEGEEYAIIKLDNRSNGLRQTDFNQWPWVKNILETTNKKNIFVVLQKPIRGQNGFTDQKEAQLLEDMLQALVQKGRNIFVIHGGEEIRANVVDGIRYISTGVQQNSGQQNSRESFRYIEFNMNSKETTYQIKSLFE